MSLGERGNPASAAVRLLFIKRKLFTQMTPQNFLQDHRKIFFALDEGHLEPAKSWKNLNQKSRPLQSPDFISLPFSAPSNNQAARSAAKLSLAASRLSRCLGRRLFSLDTSRPIAFLARFPRGDAHLRPALGLLVRQLRGVAPGFPGALQAMRGDSARGPPPLPSALRWPRRRKQPAAAERRAPTRWRLRTSSRGG